MSVFSDILVSKVSEEVLPDWTVRTLKVEKVTKLITPHTHRSNMCEHNTCTKRMNAAHWETPGRQQLHYLQIMHHLSE